MQSELKALAERVMALTGPERDRELDETCAIRLNWTQCRVTRLGLSGRTPGSYMWFRPYPQQTPPTGLRLPNMTGPRNRKATAAALLALAEQVQQ